MLISVGRDLGMNKPGCLYPAIVSSLLFALFFQERQGLERAGGDGIMSGRVHFPMLVSPFDEGGVAIGVTGYAFCVVHLQGGHEEPFVKNGRDVEYLVLAILVSGAIASLFQREVRAWSYVESLLIHAALYLQGHRHALPVV